MMISPPLKFYRRARHWATFENIYEPIPKGDGSLLWDGSDIDWPNANPRHFWTVVEADGAYSISCPAGIASTVSDTSIVNTHGAGLHPTTPCIATEAIRPDPFNPFRAHPGDPPSFREGASPGRSATTKGFQMGLDMYAFATCEDIATDIDIRSDEAHVQLHYWRKHPDLHGWMERLYRQKGGTAEFNCVGVKLSMTDLQTLQIDIEKRSLPNTNGFFFGTTDGSEEQDDLAFVHKAMNAIDNGLTVYYFSWW